jgi:hypothetical protein
MGILVSSYTLITIIVEARRIEKKLPFSNRSPKAS